MDVILYDQTNGYTYYLYARNETDPIESLNPKDLIEYEWTDTIYTNDYMHYRQLDPGVTMKVEVKLPAEATTPVSIQVTASNGISTYKNVI